MTIFGDRIFKEEQMLNEAAFIIFGNCNEIHDLPDLNNNYSSSFQKQKCPTSMCHLFGYSKGSLLLAMLAFSTSAEHKDSGVSSLFPGTLISPSIFYIHDLI